MVVSGDGSSRRSSAVRQCGPAPTNSSSYIAIAVCVGWPVPQGGALRGSCRVVSMRWGLQLLRAWCVSHRLQIQVQQQP
jgi:hypothetical protein